MSVVTEIPPERIQGVALTLIAGFLGAGKTTVLNHIVRTNPGDRLGVLVNDFGEINVDAELVANADGETLTLANGCICCTIKDDLVLTLFRLLHRPDPPRRIIVECSGISDPAEVVRSFADARFHGIVRLDSIVVVADAEHLSELEFRYQPMALHQLVSADLLVLNKVDLVTAEALASVEARLRAVVPQARVIRAERGRVPVELLTGTGRFDPARLGDDEDHGHDHDDHDHDHDHDHGAAFTSLAWTSARPLSLERLRAALDELPVAIYRAKGLVHVDGVDEHQVVVHVVGKRVELRQGEPWAAGPRASKLVVIGDAGSFDADAVLASFAACETEPGRGVGARLSSWVRRLWPQAPRGQ